MRATKIPMIPDFRFPDFLPKQYRHSSLNLTRICCALLFRNRVYDADTNQRIWYCNTDLIPASDVLFFSQTKYARKVTNNFPTVNTFTKVRKQLDKINYKIKKITKLDLYGMQEILNALQIRKTRNTYDLEVNKVI